MLWRNLEFTLLKGPPKINAELRKVQNEGNENNTEKTFHYTVTWEDALKTHVSIFNNVNVEANIFLGLLYDVLSTAVVMMIITVEEAIVVYFKVPFQYSPRQTDKNMAHT